MSGSAIGGGQEARITLPYDATCPVVYDNDDHRDVYTDEYLYALASAGQIDLRGIITSYPHDQDEYREFVAGRTWIVELARQSGMTRLPDPIGGTNVRLARPASGSIEDAAQLDCAGGRLIVEAARDASPERPLVVVMGGPLTSAADAYLIDPSIADRVVVSALFGSFDGFYRWNAGLDRWAAQIVVERLRVVIFPEVANLDFAARVPKARLPELPETPLREWMIAKHHPSNDLPSERDADGQPAISLVRPDYCRAARRVVLDPTTTGTRAASHGGTASVARPAGAPADTVPLYADDPYGRSLLVTDVDVDVATQAFFRALSNPAAYGR